MKKTLVVIILIFNSLILISQTNSIGYHFKYKKGLYYLVNPKGKKVKCEPFTFASGFSEGLALVEKDLKFGYIDSTGTIIIDYQFYDAGPFTEGVAYASNYDKHGYIDKTGQFIIKPQFDLAYPFKNELGIVKQMNPDTTIYGSSQMIYTYISKKGELIGNEFYSSISKRDSIYEAIKGDSIIHIMPDGSKQIIKQSLEQTEPNKIYIVEEMPEFPGGEMGLRNYIARNIHFPPSAQKRSIGSRVYVSFVVDNDGSVVDVLPAKPGPPILLHETMRMIKTLPKWKPGKQDGKLVKVNYIVPVNYNFQ
nr:WG repeat-containing protein [uncultured Carboxylicivirga sp.]